MALRFLFKGPQFVNAEGNDADITLCSLQGFKTTVVKNEELGIHDLDSVFSFVDKTEGFIVDEGGNGYTAEEFKDILFNDPEEMGV